MKFSLLIPAVIMSVAPVATFASDRHSSGNLQHVASAFCKESQDNITDTLKQIELMKAGADADKDNAVEYYSRQSSLRVQLNTNISELKEHGCAKYPHVISDHMFSRNSVACMMAWGNEVYNADISALQSKYISGYERQPVRITSNEVPECDTSKWSFDQKQ